jgi:replicative superfamily II helicase
VVVDELHMVADTDRGIGLEMSLSKLMFSPHARHVQVIGMSATSERVCYPAANVAARAAAGSAVVG